MCARFQLWSAKNSGQKLEGRQPLGKLLEPDALETSPEGEPDESMHDDTTIQSSAAHLHMNFSRVEKSFHMGTEANRPYIFLELCAGSASLSSEVKRLGC